MAAPSDYLRARRDPGFRERVAGAYDGAYDVLDALWWREHPGAATPEGTASPEARRAELQRAAFAPAAPGSADAVPRADRAAAELQRLDAGLARERQAIERAVAAAMRADAGRPVPGERSPDGDGRPDGAAAGERETAERDGRAPAWGAGGARAGRGTGTWARRRIAAVVAAGFVVALIGGAAGFALAQATPGTLADAAGDGPPFADASGAMAIFDRPAQPSDRPATLYSVQLREETLRSLSMADTPLYVARDIDDGVCIVLVQDDGTYTANCVPVERFPATGLLIRGSITVTGRPSQGDQAPQSFVDVEASWLPDGTTVRGQNPQTR